MFEWLFGKREKKSDEPLKEELRRSFDAVKHDISSLSVWIKHLENQDRELRRAISMVKDDLSSVYDELESVKNMIGFLGNVKKEAQNKQLFTTPQQLFKKQTAVGAVQTPVQTGVQTPNFEQFSLTERAIIWLLLNYEGPLSYEDLAVMLGKEKSTIRGQINSIRAKNEDFIKESIEKNGKKRVFIPREIKENLLQKAKVRVKENKNG
jgi:hypothetical protein